MTDYTLSENSSGQLAINGTVLTQTGISGSTPWLGNPGLPFDLQMEHYGNDNTIVVQANFGNRESPVLRIDRTALAYLQRTQTLLGTNRDGSIYFHLTPDATQSVRSSDLSISPSGRSIIVGGAYFQDITFEANGMSFVASAETYPRGAEGTAQIQAAFAMNIEALRPHTRGDSNIAPDARTRTAGNLPPH